MIRVIPQTDDITRAVATYINALVEDYSVWSDPDSDRHADRVQYFRENLSHTVGKKYIKVISEGAVNAFIVNVHDDKKFKYGDILKPASWNTPARNQARGNVFAGYAVNWTGPLYLK